MDELPTSFSEFTRIDIRSKGPIMVYGHGNSVVYAHGNSRVNSHGNSVVYAYGSSVVYAYDDSKVYAYDGSVIHAYGGSVAHAYSDSIVNTYNNSRVNANGNSVIYAYDYSVVYAYSNSIINTNDSSKVYAYGNPVVHAYDNSVIHAYDRSSINAHDNSKVYAYLTSVVYNHSTVTDLSVYDNSTLYLKVNCNNITSQDSVNIINNFIEPNFEQWLERGIVYADNIFRELKSTKTVGDKIIYHTDDGFVAKKGNKFSHGETIKDAINDLRYKISDRDKSEFKYLRKDTELYIDTAIEAYRTITGACYMGVKQFIESRNDIGDKITVNKIIDITVNSFGHDEFKKFVEKEN